LRRAMRCRRSPCSTAYPRGASQQVCRAQGVAAGLELLQSCRSLQHALLMRGFASSAGCSVRQHAQKPVWSAGPDGGSGFGRRGSRGVAGGLATQANGIGTQATQSQPASQNALGFSQVCARQPARLLSRCPPRPRAPALQQVWSRCKRPWDPPSRCDPSRRTVCLSSVAGFPGSRVRLCRMASVSWTHMARSLRRTPRSCRASRGCHRRAASLLLQVR
jgi:hypothetical protein